jgi:hypothetical protein
MPDTPIANLVPFIRLLLGDRFGAGKVDATLITAVRLCANSGQLGPLALDEGANNLTPGITLPAQFTLATCCPALALMLPDSASSGVRLRAFSRQHGDGREVVLAMRRLIAEARNGGSGRVMSGWQEYGGFCRGIGSLDDFAQAVTRLDVRAPFSQLTLAAGGASSVTGGGLADALGSGVTPVIPTPS